MSARPNTSLEPLRSKRRDTRLVGTSLISVRRITEELNPKKKYVSSCHPWYVCVRPYGTELTPQHLAWALENLVNGNIMMVRGP